MALYLLGIFMGAIDTGIVTPARTVIQRDLGVDDQVGIWMITMYTLAYAAAIPIMGKLADRVGRKRVYLVSIVLFGLGSLACGLAQDVGSFEMLVAARAVQAIGGGGILPIATAEIGTGVPPAKRGMALGLVGAVYGIANVFGASVGSLILDIAGTDNWQWIFYVNLPISVAIVGLGLAFLPDHRADVAKPIDGLGAMLLVAIILSLLYGIQNLDFLDFGASITSLEVWPFLAAGALLIPVFALVESRVADPVINLRYFTDRGIGMTLMLSALSGLILMTVVFVPQFAENNLGVQTGAGGYFVILLGLTSGVGAPLSGRLTDSFGPRKVLGFGVLVSLLAAAVVIFWAIPHPGYPSVLTSLALFGLGLGFVIGSPLNYMMLERIGKDESSSGLATLSLVRSLGTTLAPAIMVGFLAQAGLTLQDRLIAELPTSVAVPALPHAAVLEQRFADLKADEEFADELAGFELPDLSGRDTIEIDLAGGDGLPADLEDLLKTADVTTIAERTQVVARRMFETQTPARVSEIQAGVDEGLSALEKARLGLVDAEAELVDGLAELDAQLRDVLDAIAEMDAALDGMASGLAGLTEAIDGVGQGIKGMDAGLAQQRSALAGIEAALDAAQVVVPTATATASVAPSASVVPSTPPSGVPSGTAIVPSATPGGSATVPSASASASGTVSATPLAGPPAGVAGAAAGSIAQLEAQAAALRAAIAALEGERDEAVVQLRSLSGQRERLQAQSDELTDARADLIAARDGIADGHAEVTDALSGVRDAQAEVADTFAKLTELRAAVPGAFDEALATYLAELDARSDRLEATFQGTLNEGFRSIFWFYAAACALALVILPLVPRAPRRAEPAVPQPPADAPE